MSPSVSIRNSKRAEHGQTLDRRKNDGEKAVLICGADRMQVRRSEMTNPLQFKKDFREAI
jgi:hypothetical protein